MNSRKSLITILLVVLLFVLTSVEGSVKRFALIAGANYGGADRATLKYAESDAENFAHVMSTLGGVDPNDYLLLNQPSVIDLISAMNSLEKRINESNSTRTVGDLNRTEVLFYYSGHANERGLLLGEDTIGYRNLKDWMNSLNAEVRIAILDACESGAITRLKGGKRRKPFLIDSSSDMRGHAFLTSSSADEAAQESDQIGASFFTYFLVSGLRGAADVTGEGKVTLNEAYQFAFHETLGQTTSTRGGAQHPAYDIDLAGTGDVVMTDLRETSAGLLLDKDVSGRIFIRNSSQQLVVELQKTKGRVVELGLEPGDYEVRCENDGGAWISNLELKEGNQSSLDFSQFNPTTPQQTRSRGNIFDQNWTLTGRNRIGASVGLWNLDKSGSSSPGVVEISNIAAGLGYSHWFNDSLALNFTLSGVAADIKIAPSVKSTTVVAVLLGTRWYPTDLGTRNRFKPYLAVSAGPYVGTGVETGFPTGTKTTAAAGVQLGGGFDGQITPYLMLGVRAGYNLISDFPVTLAGRENYSGFELGVEIGWLFGGK